MTISRLKDRFISCLPPGNAALSCYNGKKDPSRKRVFMTKRIFFSIFVLIPVALYGTLLQSINFQQKGNTSSLEFVFDSKDFKARSFSVREDKQIIVDIEGVTANSKVLRPFDTSEFEGPVVFVSPYVRPGGGNNIRVVLQLRDNVGSALSVQEDKATLTVENRFGAFAASGITSPDGGTDTSVNIPKSDSIEDILENLTLSGPKQYVGKKISINAKGLSLEDTLKTIAEISGLNIILTDQARNSPPLSLSMVDIPWDQALDTLMDLNGLVAQKSGAILIIRTYAEMAERKKAEEEQEKAMAAAEGSENLETRILPINYADTAALSGMLKPYLTKEQGEIADDKRTNYLIVKDKPEVIEKIRGIVGALDTQTPQVLIESKIVEVNESYSKTLGFMQGVNFAYDPIGRVPNTNQGPGFTFSTAPVGGDGGRNTAGLVITRFSRFLNLNFQLQLMESESKGKVVASPKVITQHNQAATITSSDETSFEVVQGTPPDSQTTYQTVSATLTMEVTPKVTNEGSINMDISIDKGSFGARPSTGSPPNQTKRSVKTSVLVDNGATVVIGGLYNYSKAEAHSGIPFLKDIPLLGWLFRTPYAPQTVKSEMMIFLTPRIVNPQETPQTQEAMETAENV